MQRLIAFLSALGFLLQPAYALAALDIASYNLTEREERILFRSCSRANESEMERCRYRQLQRMGYQDTEDGQANPANTIDVWDKMDLGQHRLRLRLQRNRTEYNKALWDATRTTYRERKFDQENALQQRSYVNDIREGRRNCMRDARRGRERRMCLDTLAQDARAQMQEERPSMR